MYRALSCKRLLFFHKSLCFALSVQLPLRTCLPILLRHFSVPDQYFLVFPISILICSA